MKLHLPLLLRSALLALGCAAMVTNSAASTAPSFYWTDANGEQHQIDDQEISESYMPSFELLGEKLTPGALEFIVTDHDLLTEASQMNGPLDIKIQDDREDVNDVITAKKVIWSRNVIGACTSYEYEDKTYYYGSARGGVLNIGDLYGVKSQYTMSISGCDDVTITNNGVRGQISTNPMSNNDDAMAQGGAIYLYGNMVRGYEKGNQRTALEFKDNGKVYIRGNYTYDGVETVMNAIYAENADVAFAAKAGQSVEIYDSVQINHGTLWINATNPALGDEQVYAGTVKLSGTNTAEDIQKIKGSAATETELAKSRLISAEFVHIESGTLQLENITLEAVVKSISFAGDITFYSSKAAEVQMRDATIRAYQTWDGIYSGEENMYIVVNKASFTGHNVLEGNFIQATDNTWTFRVGAVNKDEAVLSIVFDDHHSGLDDSVWYAFKDNILSNIPGVKHEPERGNMMQRFLYTGNMSFHVVAAGSLETGDYKLLEFDNELGLWIGKDEVSFSGLVFGSLDDMQSDNTLYITTKDDTFILWLNYTGADAVMRAATELTWQAEKGEWTTGSGAEEGNWSGEVEDLNFYTGDSVVFGTAAEVTVADVVRPAHVLVNNESGEVVFIGNGDGQISGAGKLTKEGKGVLQLNLANAYTGDTNVIDGKLVVGNERALGLSTVKMSGGTLDLADYEVSNNIEVAATGDVVIENGSNFAGKLTVKGGNLKGDELRLVQDAQLEGGSILNDLVAAPVSGNLRSSQAKVRLVVDTLVSPGAKIGGMVDENIDIKVTYGKLTLLKSAVINGDIELYGSTSELYMEKDASVLGCIYLRNSAKLSSAGAIVLDNGKELISTGNISADVEVQTGGTLWIGSKQTLDGSLTLSGGTVRLEDTLTIGKTLSITKKTDVLVDLDKLVADKRLTLFETNDVSGVDTTLITLSQLEGSRMEVGVSEDNTAIWVNINNACLVWKAGDGGTGTWGVKKGEWQTDATDKRFYNLDAVSFENAGEVSIEDEVQPSSIEVKGNKNTVFTGNGQIIGNASLVKSDTGDLVINTSNSNYSGHIDVQKGALVVGNSNALGLGGVQVQSGATLNAAGYSIGNEVHLRGGATLNGAQHVTQIFLHGAGVKGDGLMLTRGHSLTVTSSLASYVGSSFTFDGGDLILQGNGSRLDLRGTEVTLGANATRINVNGWHVERGQSYALVDMRVSKDAAEHFTIEGPRWYTLEYHDDILWLTIDQPTVGAPDIRAALSHNQRAVYNALFDIVQSGADRGELTEMAEAVFAAPDAATAAAVLDKVSGAELATAMSSQIEGNLAHLRRLRSHIGSGQGFSADGQGSVYVAGYGDWQRVKADALGRGIHRSEWGGLLGIENKLAENSISGVALSSGRARVEPSAADRYHENTTHVDFYVVAGLGNGWQSVTSLGAGLHEFSATRHLPGGYRAKSSVNGASFNMQEELSCTFSLDESSSLQPFFQLETSANGINAFEETGAGSASLRGDSRSAWATEITLGARYVQSFDASAGKGYFSVQTGVTMSVGDTTADLDLYFVGASEKRFRVSTADRNRWGYNLGVGLFLPMSASTAVTASAGTVLRGDSGETSASVGVRISF